MKKYYIKLIGVILFLSFLTSCNDFLDRKPDDQIDEQTVFTRYEKVNNLVAQLYFDAKRAQRPLVFFDHFSSAAITDECEGTAVEGGITNLFNNGAWNSMSLPGSCGQYWWDLYASIRHANVILEGVEKYKTPDNPIQDGDLNKRIGEVYFLRAYFHFLLFRMYGEVPYIDWVIKTQEPKTFTKESVHSVGDKIVADCREAFKRLPAKYGLRAIDFGHVDQGACLGLIAATRWMEATPLWNSADQHGYTGNRIFESEYKYEANRFTARWDSAKVAAKALLDFQVNGAPRYSLYKTHGETDFNDPNGQDLNNSTVYARLWDMYFDMAAYENEAVFFVTRDKWEAWQGDIYPPSRGGSSRQQPVQEQVDEYEYKAPDGFGYPVYSTEAKTAGYDDENPYVNRDPRFYRDIIFHGCNYRNNSNKAAITNTAIAPDKIGAGNATSTGYYLRKFQKESWNKSGSFDLNGPPIFRLPEFIYIYAEAVNETTGPNQEIYDLINSVRARSFMSPMPTTVLASKSLMREYIKRERRVEFFYETKRPFDCRLYLEPTSAEELAKEAAWKNSGATNNERSQAYWANGNGDYPKCQRMINGMRPVLDPNGKIEIAGKKYKMERFIVEERVFEMKHYLFPIMDTEIQRCPTLVQNPGW